MTDNKHPISPPPELVEQWRNLPEYVSQLRTMSTVTITTEKLQDIATQAARWGSDQELKACCDHIWDYQCGFVDRPDGRKMHRAVDLELARRPKPPSLKEQAQRILVENGTTLDGRMELDPDDIAIIRRALEQLDD